MTAVRETEARREVRALCAERCLGEMPIVDMNRATATLRGADGLDYREVVESVWAATSGEPQVVYLQTMTHGGGICLRPLYVRTPRDWLNATTGEPAPASLELERRLQSN